MARQHAFPQYPGVSTKLDRHGETFYRFRHKAVGDIKMRAAFGTPEFDREFAGIVAKVNAAAAAGSKPAPVKGPGFATPLPVTAAEGLRPVIGLETFRHAWVLLKKSLHWDGLKPDTQNRNRDSIEKFLLTPVFADADEPWLWADAPMAETKADQLQEHYEAMYRHSPAMAKLRIEAIGKLYTQAVKAKWIEREENKTKFLDMLPMPESNANRPWEDEDKALFEARWPLGTPARTAYEIGLALGARRGDIGQLTPGHIIDRVAMKSGQVVRRFRAIQWDTQKGRKGKEPMVAYHRVSERLEKALAALAHDMDPKKPFLRKRSGEAYPAVYLSQRMIDWTKAAGMEKGLTLHGLRHTLGSELSAQGFSDRQIAVALTHKNPSTTARYTRRVNRETVMDSIGEAQNGPGQTTTFKTVGHLKAVTG